MQLSMGYSPTATADSKFSTTSSFSGGFAEELR
jgi:hypothetical protein